MRGELPQNESIAGQVARPAKLISGRLGSQAKGENQWQVERREADNICIRVAFAFVHRCQIVGRFDAFRIELGSGRGGRGLAKEHGVALLIRR